VGLCAEAATVEGGWGASVEWAGGVALEKLKMPKNTVFCTDATVLPDGLYGAGLRWLTVGKSGYGEMGLF
jgi:hypothetical protein